MPTYENSHFEKITNQEAFFALLRRLNDVAISMPKKECDKILEIADKLSELNVFPNRIRIKKEYLDKDGWF